MAIIKIIQETDIGPGLTITANQVVADVDGTTVQLNGSNQISTVLDPQVVADLVTLSGVPANSTDYGTNFTGSIIPDNATTLAAIQALETALETQNITGQFAGSAATFAALPTTTDDGNPVNNGDWAILTTDDGASQAGIYAFDGTAYVLAKEIPEAFSLVVTTADSDNIAFTGDGNTGTPLSADLIIDPLAGNLLSTSAAGAAVDPADVKAALTFDCELQDLASNTLAYVNSAANFA